MTVPRVLFRDADLSPCGTYRHRLFRRWRKFGSYRKVAGFVMLNPSTADHREDDPTIRRCMSFAEREDCGALFVVNLYQLRATDPSELGKHPDPVGPDADYHISEVAKLVNGPLIAAWGTKGGTRGEEVASQWGGVLQCLRLTKKGHPEHPLYLPEDSPLQPFRSVL